MHLVRSSAAVSAAVLGLPSNRPRTCCWSRFPPYNELSYNEPSPSTAQLTASHTGRGEKKHTPQKRGGQGKKHWQEEKRAVPNSEVLPVRQQEGAAATSLQGTAKLLLAAVCRPLPTFAFLHHN